MLNAIDTTAVQMVKNLTGRTITNKLTLSVQSSRVGLCEVQTKSENDQQLQNIIINDINQQSTELKSTKQYQKKEGRDQHTLKQKDKH